MKAPHTSTAIALLLGLGVGLGSVPGRAEQTGAKQMQSEQTDMQSQESASEPFGMMRQSLQRIGQALEQEDMAGAQQALDQARQELDQAQQQASPEQQQVLDETGRALEQVQQALDQQDIETAMQSIEQAEQGLQADQQSGALGQGTAQDQNAAQVTVITPDDQRSQDTGAASTSGASDVQQPQAEAGAETGAARADDEQRGGLEPGAEQDQGLDPAQHDLDEARQGQDSDAASGASADRMQQPQGEDGEATDPTAADDQERMAAGEEQPGTGLEPGMAEEEKTMPIEEREQLETSETQPDDQAGTDPSAVGEGPDAAPSAGSADAESMTDEHPLYGMTVADLIGTSVVNEQGDGIGDIEDLVLNPMDDAVYAVLSVGGFLGLGSKSIPVAIDEFELVGDQVMLPGADKDQLKERADFDEAAYQPLLRETQIGERVVAEARL